MNKYEEHRKICGILNLMYKAKNEDYGDSFAKGFAEYGMTMPIIRMEDKLNRIKSIVKKASINVKDEKLGDTLLDLANYAIMTVIELDRDIKNIDNCKEI